MSSGLGLIALTAATGSGLIAGIVVLRLSDQERRDSGRRVFVVSFPRTVKVEHLRAYVATLMGLTSPVLGLRGRDAAVFEIVGRQNGIEHRLRLPYGSADYYVTQLRAAVPGVTVEELDEADKTFELPPLDQVRELRRTRHDAPLAKADPAAIARTVLAACTDLKRGEAVVWQWSVTGGRPERAHPTAAQSWWQDLGRSLSGENTAGTPLPSAYNDGLISVVGRVGATGTTQRKSRHLIARLVRASATVAAPGARLVPRLIPGMIVRRRITRGTTPLIEAPVRVTPDELIGLLGLPIDGPLIPGLVLGRRPQLLASPLVPHGGRLLGYSTVAEKRAVAQSLRGSLEHSLIVGPTGSGKTWLAAQLALEDIAAGRGTLVIDPKGGLIKAICERLPEEAIERVVLVDPTDEARPVPLPLLGGESGGIPELAADNLIALLRHRYRDIGPRSSDILSSSLYALARLPETSIFDLLPLWSEAKFRAKVVGLAGNDPALRSFFAWFEGMSPAERNFVLAAPMNKIRPLLQRPLVRNVIAAPKPTFTMSEALAKRLIVLVSLPEGVLGSEATTLIGQVLLARLWSAIQGRSGSSRRPYLVTVDEAPRFVDQPTDLGDMLARSREYGVGVTLVTQSLTQFPTSLREIALNSARSKVAFQTSASDAKRMADEFGPTVAPEMLAGLAAFEAIGMVSIGGSVTEPFTFTTRALDPPSPGRAAAVRKASREKYGVPRAELEARFRVPTKPPEEPPGQVGRRYES